MCLVRVFADSVQIEVFRAGSRRPSIHPQAKYDEALRAIAPIVSQWLIVPRQAEPVDIPQGTDEVVVLTGADQAAIVAAYRLVKGANDAAERVGSARPALSVAVLGADSAETAHVAARSSAHADRPHSPFRGLYQAAGGNAPAAFFLAL